MTKPEIKVKFKKPEDPGLQFQDPVEIFCPQKYKGYYLRGQVVELHDNINDASLPQGYGHAVYHFRIFALINDAHAKSIDLEEESLEYIRLGTLIGRTKTEFLKIQHDRALDFAKDAAHDLKSTPDKLLKEELSTKNNPVEISLKDFGIQETSYLLNSIRNNKDAIVLKIDIRLDRVLDPESEKDKLLSRQLKRIYQLPAYHLAKNSEYHEDDIERLFFDALFDILYFKLDYNFTDKREYRRLLNEIAELGYEWIKSQSVSTQYIAKLNKFNAAVKDRSFPFYDFCYGFFDDLLDELKEKQKITQCSFCGNIFSFHKSRKYCALQTEGKDCGKPARNKRFYIKHRDEILPKARKTTRGLRALYRQKGIKK